MDIKSVYVYDRLHGTEN